MKRYKISIVLAAFLFASNANAQEEIQITNHQHYNSSSITINLFDKDLNIPISDAKIVIKELGIEAFTDQNGKADFSKIPSRSYTINVEHGDYLIQDFIIDGKQSNYEFKISANTLNLEQVVVIGQEGNNNGSTSTVINRKAIEHLQATSLQEVLQLLPGNIVNNPDFKQANQANIRQIVNLKGYYRPENEFGSFGTSVIVNGSSISNNANLQVSNSATGGTTAGFSTSSGGGVDLRQINADNIESVEVIRGIPSVEYGDLNSGAIVVQTKARKEPLQLKARFNPALTQFWAGKGFEIGKDGGSLFVDLDYTKSNDKETNKYQTYTRSTGSLQYTNRFGKKRNWRSNSTLAFTYSNDVYNLDPDKVYDQSKNNAKERYIRFSTNGVIDLDKKFSRTIKYAASLNYGVQSGYDQNYYDADITAESHALINGTNRVDYLPSSYLSKMWIDGKPLTVSAKVSNQFYFLTGELNHSILAGIDWSMDANYGDGKTFTRQPRNTNGSAYRARTFNSIPAMHQLSGYVQDHMSASIGEDKLNVVAGLRYDVVQPFESSYDLNALSPRVNASYKMSNGLTVRGGYGITAKAPTLLNLYPENAYFDFYSLNYYASNEAERLAYITTHVYNTENHNIKLAKTNKAEVGFDFEWGKSQKQRLSVTGFHEKTKNGYSMSTTLNSVQFANTPIYSVAEQTSGQEPILSDVVTNKTRFVSYLTPTNNINRTNKGIEFELDLGKFKPINTTFNISGAYIYAKTITNNPYILQQDVAGKENTRIGLFAPGRGRIDERFMTTIRAIHHIPELRFIVTLSAQTIWMDQNKYVGYESIPIGYIPIQQNGTPTVTYFTETERQSINNVSDPDLYLSINDNIYKTEKWKPLWLFNLKLTKEFKSGLNFSFFANNFINNRPLQSGTRYPTEYTKRNIDFFFGSEISIKL
jgi:outer membrane receptor protein involved in Fe transport